MKKALLLFVPLLFWGYLLNAQSTYTFNYTGNVQQWTVPEGVSTLLIDVYGAAGGDGDNGSGGRGGRSQGYLQVTPGQVLNIYVGGQGNVTNTVSTWASGGYNGGGSAYLGSSPYGPVGAGGGASDVRIAPYTLSDRVIVAGGGGGGAGRGWLSGPGGSGGGNVGADAINQGGYNRGGTQTAGGANPYYSSYNGQWGQGGNVSPGFYHSSGGGGGYYGGSAGACSGGAGGSGYIGGVTDGITTTYAKTGNGQVIIKAGTLQTITFNELAPVEYGASSFTISATGGASGNPVTFTSSAPHIAECSGPYGATITIWEVGPCTIYANQAGNDTYLPALQVAQPLTINKKAVTITGVTAANKPYDGNTTATLTTGTLNGLVNYDSYFVSITKGTGTFDDKNVGNNKPVTATGYKLSGYYAYNYYLAAQPSGMTANITPKALSVTNAIITKTYTGTTDAVITDALLSGVVGSEVVTLENASSGTYALPNAGTNIPVTTSMTIAGTDVGNYTLPQPSLKGTILPKELAVVNALVIPKAYDGTTEATLTDAELSGVIGSDEVILENATLGTYMEKWAGTDIPVTTEMTLGGLAANNYTLTQSNLMGNILPKELTVTNAIVTPKLYDKNTDAEITGATLSGVIEPDPVMLENASSGTFTQAEAGNNIPIITAMTLNGNGIANYKLIQPTLTGNILPRELTVSNASVSSKVYDRTTTAEITGATLSEPLEGDVVTLENKTSGTFAQAGAGPNIPVTSAMTLSGEDALNYTVVQPSLSASILPKEVTVINAHVLPKAYDGNTDAFLAGSTLSGVLGSDEVTLNNATLGVYDQVGKGSNILVTSAMVLGGSEAANYNLAAQPTLTGDILPKALQVVNANVKSKLYDGFTEAEITGATLSGVVEPEAISLENSTTGTFAKASADTDIPVSTTMTISGANVGNYTLTQPTLTGIIQPRELNISNAAVTSKVYDGSTDAEITGATLSEPIGTDIVTLENKTAGTFDQTGVGVDIPVSVAMTLSGADAGNYVITQPNLTGTIIAAELTATADNCSKIYGDANPEFTISYQGFVGDDSKTTIIEPAINCEALTTSKVDSYDILLSGGSATNYQLILKNGILTVNKAPLSVSANVYMRAQNELNPAFTFTYSGFKNDDTEEVLDTKPAIICTAGASSTVGNYDLTFTEGVDDNYDFIYFPGKLTITPATTLTETPTAGYTAYPNPVTDFLIVKSSDSKPVHVKLFDGLGRLMLEQTEVSEPLNVQQLKPGLYLLNLNGFLIKLVKK